MIQEYSVGCINYPSIPPVKCYIILVTYKYNKYIIKVENRGISMEDKKNSKDIIYIIIIVILLMIICGGVAFNLGRKYAIEEDKRETKETKITDKKDNDSNEEGENDKPSNEQPTNEEPSREEPSNNEPDNNIIKKADYKDISNECFNKGNCEKSFELNNGEKTIIIKINNRKGSYETTMYIDNRQIDEVRQNLEGINMRTTFNKIAYLDNGFIVIEMQTETGIERYYYDKNYIKIAIANEYSYDKNYTIKEDITSKVINYYKTEPGCDSEGKYRKIYQYKLTLSDNNGYKDEFVKEGQIVCAGQS